MTCHNMTGGGGVDDFSWWNTYRNWHSCDLDPNQSLYQRVLLDLMDKWLVTRHEL